MQSLASVPRAPGAAPEVSVVLCAYNAERTLRSALESCCDESNGDFEVVAVDDGSTDGSARILRELAQRSARFKVVHKANSGLTASLNTALAHARGRFVARLDADDVSMPGRIAAQRDFLLAHPQIGLVGSNAVIIDDHGREIGRTSLGRLDAEQCRTRLLALEPFFPHSSWMLRRSVIDRTGGYDEFFRKAQDFDLLLRISAEHGIACMSERLIKLRKSPTSVTYDESLSQFRYALVALVLHCVRSGHCAPLAEMNKAALWDAIGEFLEATQLRKRMLAQQALSFSVYALRAREWRRCLDEALRAASLDRLFFLRRPWLARRRRHMWSTLVQYLNRTSATGLIDDRLS